MSLENDIDHMRQLILTVARIWIFFIPFDHFTFYFIAIKTVNECYNEAFFSPNETFLSVDFFVQAMIYEDDPCN